VAANTSRPSPDSHATTRSADDDSHFYATRPDRDQAQFDSPGQSRRRGSTDVAGAQRLRESVAPSWIAFASRTTPLSDHGCRLARKPAKHYLWENPRHRPTDDHSPAASRVARPIGASGCFTVAFPQKRFMVERAAVWDHPVPAGGGGPMQDRASVDGRRSAACQRAIVKPIVCDVSACPSTCNVAVRRYLPAVRV
jgi:hypothetical protein